MTILGAAFAVTCAFVWPPPAGPVPATPPATVAPGAAAPAGAPVAAPAGAGSVLPAAPGGARSVPPAASPPVGPTTVTLVPERSSLTLGADESTRIDVTVAGDGAALAAPGPVEVTVGTVEPLEAGKTPGTFTTVFHVPSDRRPQSALVSVEVALPSGARRRGTAVIALPARTKFPFRTDPSAVVTLAVAGRSFGPVTADVRGNVAIPIVVPPGIESAQATARGRFGGVKEMQVDLQTRDYPRLLLFASPVAETGAVVEVEVWAVEPTGERAVPEDIDLRASAGTVRRGEGGRGVARFLVTLPQDLAGAAPGGAVALTASMNDGSSERSLVVALHPGPATALGISPSLPQLLVGSPEVSEIEIAATDRWQNRTAIAGVTLTIDDRAVPVAVAPGGGVVRFRLPAPAAWPGREHVALVARLGALVARKEIMLHGGAPATLRLRAPSRRRIPGDGRTSLDLVVEVFDRLGTPTTTGRIVWSTADQGTLQALASPGFGTYAARFTPSRGLRDRQTDIVVTVDQGVSAKTRLTIETTLGPTATARVGLISNFHGLFGESALVEGSLPVSRTHTVGRVLSLGLAAGYIHSDVSTTGATGPAVPALHTNLSQFPLLAFVRAHLPLRLPAELSLTALGGGTWAASESTEKVGSSVVSRGAAVGAAIGGGADVAFPLPPGELVLGLRYLWLGAGRLSNGDALAGNLGGLLVDVGYRLRL